MKVTLLQMMFLRQAVEFLGVGMVKSLPHWTPSKDSLCYKRMFERMHPLKSVKTSLHWWTLDNDIDNLSLPKQSTYDLSSPDERFVCIFSPK